MSGVLHPRGPHQPRVYWIRRGVLVAAVLVVVGLVWGVVVAVSPKQANDPRPLTQTTSAARTTARPSSPTATTPAASSASASPTAPVTTAQPTTEPPPPSTTTPPAPQPCATSALAVTVSGEPRVKSEATTSFTVSVINNGPVPCVLAINQKTYSLKVTSGSDQIWSTDDCAAWLGGDKTVTLDPAKAMEWNIGWNTRRSQADCKVTGDYLRPGTYLVTASYLGVPSQAFRVVLYG